MSKKQLIALFLCGFLCLIVMNGLLPLLPVYATSLGASPTLTGSYLAFAFLTMTIGSVSAGWLSDRLQLIATILLLPIQQKQLQPEKKTAAN